MHLHVCRLKLLVGLVLPKASRLIARDGCLLRTYQSQFHHACVAFLAHHVPSFVVHSIIFLYVFRLGVQRPVRCVVCHVHEERLLLGGEVVDEVYGLVCDEVGGIEVRRYCVGVYRFFVVYERERVEVVHDAPYRSPVLVESAVARIGLNWSERPVVECVLMGEPCHLVGIVAYALRERQMPLAGHGSVIAGGLENLGYGDAFGVETLSHRHDARLLCVESCHECGS